MPTLRSIIGEEHYISVRPTSTVREAATLMAKVRKGVLVIEEGALVGIFTPKDLLSRVVAKELCPDTICVSQVMTPNPDCVAPDLTLLDALREMHDHKFLHLPVREEDGTILGLVDVMELVCNTAGGDGKGWRDFFSSAAALAGDKDFSETSSQHSASASTLSKTAGGGKAKPIRATYLDDDATSDVFSVGTDFKMRQNSNSPLRGGYGYEDFIFKVTDQAGNNHRIKSNTESAEALKLAIAEKLNVSIDALTIKYVDDDKDEIVITNDASLRDAIEFARSSGMTALKINASITASSLSAGASSFIKAAFSSTAAALSTPAKAASSNLSNKNDKKEDTLSPIKETKEGSGGEKQAASSSTSSSFVPISIGITAVTALAIGVVVFMRSSKK